MTKEPHHGVRWLRDYAALGAALIFKKMQVGLTLPIRSNFKATFSFSFLSPEHLNIPFFPGVHDGSSQRSHPIIISTFFGGRFTHR